MTSNIYSHLDFQINKLTYYKQLKTNDVFKKDVDHLRSKQIEEKREHILDSLNSATSQISRNRCIHQLLLLPPPSPPTAAEFKCFVNESDRQTDNDANRYKKELADMKAAESLFCEENDLFVEQSLKS